MIKLMDMESIHILMELNMSALGKMINKMDKESRNGSMEKDMRDSINMEPKLAKEY